MIKKELMIFSVMLCSSLLLSGTAFAETEDATTEGYITFEVNDEPTDPVDPTDPENPLDPEDPSNPGTGQVGDLTLDYVPSLDFGKHTTKAGEYKSVNNEKETFLQVTDKRGTGAGWQVSLSISEFEDASGTKKLNGAALILNEPEVKAVPKQSAGTKPTAESKTIAVTDSAVPIFQADEDGGLGTWLSTYDPDNVKLDVPVAATGEFTADLTWSLTEGPAS